MSSIDERRLSVLLERVYETPDAPARWPCVLSDLADAVGAKSGLLRILDLRGDWTVCASYHHNLDDGLQAEYRAGLVGLDPYLEPLRRLPPGYIVTNDELVDPGTLRGTYFYEHYLGPLENDFMVGGFVQRDARDRFTIFGLHRHSHTGRFSRDEVDTVRLLTPHLRRAVRLSNILARESCRADSAEAALDALSVAAYLLDGDGRVTHTNPQGDRLLAMSQGVRLRDGRLVASHAETHAFADLLARVQRSADGYDQPVPQSLLLPERGDAEPNLLAIAMPIRGHRHELRDTWPEASVAVYVGDLDDTGLLRPDVLQNLYGMTQAEARLAVALARGRELPELRDDWGVSADTLRTQLKAVFAKTGCRRQAGLVRLLAGAPWKLAAPNMETREPH